MTKPSKVKIGLVGLGNIGALHARYLKDLPNVELVGVCDIDRAKADSFAAECRSKAYYDYRDLYAQSGLQAVLIAVPHYDHTPLTIAAFDQGLHVMCEKPLAVHVNDAQKMIAAWEHAKLSKPELIFAAMFMERSYAHYRKIKDIIQGGELGRLTRVTWILTTWFRTQTYYNSSSWRATWAGEGGGILSNQCPHNLDMYQWLFGLPLQVSGQVSLGKYHQIEVEDEVSAYFEHANGMIGHFIANTGESPGTNHLEIVGEFGKLVLTNNQLTFYRNRESMLEFLKTSPESFASVENWPCQIPLPAEYKTPAHQLVTERFLETIQTGRDCLIAWGSEGLNAVSIANAIMLSSFEQRKVELPLDGNPYEAKLQELIRGSQFSKPAPSATSQADMATSFSK